mmetsp:Transcript_31280/g.78362  ORF Transcript_31280/g.78362 Transcript_31280/m.78362 type:complete len:213 (-) Transcript_31280:1274-1912(-)
MSLAAAYDPRCTRTSSARSSKITGWNARFAFHEARLVDPSMTTHRSPVVSSAATQKATGSALDDDDEDDELPTSEVVDDDDEEEAWKESSGLEAEEPPSARREPRASRLSFSTESHAGVPPPQSLIVVDGDGDAPDVKAPPVVAVRSRTFFFCVSPCASSCFIAVAACLIASLAASIEPPAEPPADNTEARVSSSMAASTADVARSTAAISA